LIPTFIDKTVIQIECGHRYTMFLTDDNELFGSGKNYSGQLGLGHTAPVYTATKVTTKEIVESRIAKIHCGHAHTILMLENKDCLVFGWNTSGQAGIGSYGAQVTPIKIPMFSGPLGRKLRDIVCSQYTTVFLLENNEIWTVGMNKHGVLGQETDVEKSHTPAPLSSTLLDFKRCVSVSGGSYHLVFVLEDVRSCNVGIDDKLKDSLKSIMSEESQLLTKYNFRNSTLHLNRDIIKVRCPILLQIQNTAEEKEVEDEPPRKKMKMSENVTYNDSIIAAFESHDLSFDALALIIDFCNRDELSEMYRQNEIENVEIISVLTEVYLWLCHKLSQSELTTAMMNRLLSIVLRRLLCQITTSSVVNVLLSIEKKIEEGEVLTIKNNLMERVTPFRQHLIALLNSATDFAQTPDTDKLSKNLLFEILSKKYTLLKEENVMIPPTEFAQDMKQLYILIQKETNWLSSSEDHVVLLLDRSKKYLINAHKSILSSRCDYFKSKFHSGMTDEHSQEVTMFIEEDEDDEDEIRLKTVHEFIEYLYSGVMTVNSSNAISMLNIWNFYSMPVDDPIPTYCQRLIMKEVNEDNILEMVVTFLKSEIQYPLLHEFYIQTIVKHWTQLHKKHTTKALINLLSLDLYLQINQEYLKATEALSAYM
jgi:alpha-tubulin suppressor-like RCC1 family protein